MQMNAFNNKTFIISATIEHDQLKQRQEEATNNLQQQANHPRQPNTSSHLKISPVPNQPQQTTQQQTRLLDQPPPPTLFLRSTLPQDQQLANPQQHIPQQIANQPIIQTPGSFPPLNQPPHQQLLTYNNHEHSFAFQLPPNPPQ